MANTKNVQLVPTEVLSLPQPPLRKAEDYLKAYNGYTYTAVSSIADAVASIQLHLFKRKFTKKGADADEIFEHEALSLLYYSNPQMTYYDLIEATQVYLDLVGEAFWIILRDGGVPAELWPVRPDWMSIKPSATEVVDSYTYNPGGNTTRGIKFAKEDVVHFKYFNPMNPYRGKGSVQAAAMAIDVHDFASEWNRNFFYNSAMPGLVFTTDQKLSQAVIERFKESWQAKFGGRENSNKVAFLGGGFKMEKASQTAKEMDFKDLKAVMRDDILATFKVPRTVLGLTEDVNRANAEATTISFMERVITPRMTKFVAHLNEFYLKNWEDDLFFNFDDPAPEDTEMKLSVYQSGLSLGWLTRNEVREQENLPPVEGGDVIYIPFSSTPLGDTPDAATGTKPPKDDGEDKGILSRLFGGKKKKVDFIALPLKKSTAPKRRKFMMPIPPARLKDLAKKRLKGEVEVELIKLIGNLMSKGTGGVRRAKQKSTWTEEKREAYWSKMVAKTDVLEDKLKNLIIPLLVDQEKAVKGNIDSLKGMIPSRMKASESSFLFSITEETKKWVGVILPFQKNVIIDKGNEVLDFLGLSTFFDTWTRDSVNFIRRDGTKIIRNINETTRDLLKDSLAEGLQKGESVDQLKSRVSSIFVSARTSRAEQIARTEVIRATNFATEEAYRQSKIVKAKEWLTAIDERVCPWCASMDGKIIPVDKSFFEEGGSLTVDGKTIKFDLLGVDHPPLHPNCRCTLIPVL